MTNSIEEIGDARCILAIGTNTTDDHPVIALEIKKAIDKGGKLIVADPRKIWYSFASRDRTVRKPALSSPVISRGATRGPQRPASRPSSIQ